MLGKDDNRNISRIRQTVTNIVLVFLVTIGMYMTMTYRSAWMEFQMRDIMCLRYFTVQSNLFAGIISVSFGIACLLSLLNSKVHIKEEEN